LMTPTRIYVKPLLELFSKIDVHALAHITGGGLLENIPRVIPEGLGVRLDASSWELPAVFRWLQENGNIAAREMHRTFNCGIGMTVIVEAANADATVTLLRELGEDAGRIGEVVAGMDGVEIA